MGNSAGIKAAFCCKGRRGFDSLLNGDGTDETEGGGVVSYFEYTAD